MNKKEQLYVMWNLLKCLVLYLSYIFHYSFMNFDGCLKKLGKLGNILCNLHVQ